MPRKKGTPKTGGRKPGSVNKATAALRARLLRDETLTVESTVEAIRRGMQFDPRCVFDPVTKRLKHPTELTEEEAWCIDSYEIIIKNAEAGDGHTDTVAKLKFQRRKDYVELAARHQGMLHDKVDVNVTDVGAKLDAARQIARERNTSKSPAK